MRIEITENGFVLLRGEKRSVIRRGGSEQTVDRVRIALCRCGGSTSKPYCDLTHSQVRFVAARSEIESQPIHETGDREGHDNLLVDKIQELAGTVDVVVLAQASMARVLPRLSVADQNKILISPRLAMERVKSIISDKFPAVPAQLSKGD